MRANIIAGAWRRYELLVDALEKPKCAPEWLAKACETQGSLASVRDIPAGETSAEDDPNKLRGMSLNTLKDAADQAIERGGWAELNRLRIEYLRLITNIQNKQVDSPKRRSNAGLNENIKSLTEVLNVERQGRLRLGRAYFDLLKTAQEIAKNDEVRLQRIARHQALYGSNLGLQAIQGAGNEPEATV